MKEFFPIIRSSQLFSGVSEEELTAMLSCLETRKESFPKDALCCASGIRQMPSVLCCRAVF